MRKVPARGSLRFLLLLVESDRRRYSKWWRHRGFRACLSYRMGHAVATSGGLCRMVALTMLVPMKILGALWSQAEISSMFRCGPGLFLPHPQGVVIANGVRAGSGVSLFQQVTLGEWDRGVPRIASRVTVFAGAKVFGDLRVGRRSFIGANAVVVRNVPAWSTAIGVPAQSRPRCRGAMPKPETSMNTCPQKQLGAACGMDVSRIA